MAIVTQAGDQIVTQGGSVLTQRIAPAPVTAIVPIEKLRVSIGLTANDSSRDAELILVWEASLQMMETYCNRKFTYATDREEFIHKVGENISLRRYPVESISSATGENGRGYSAYHYDKETGVVYFDNVVVEHKLVVEYVGGYKVLPADLELVALSTFSKLWSIQSGGAGVAVGGIKTIRAGDLSVTYDTGSATSSSSSATGFGGLFDPMSSAILDLYRREYC